MKFQYTAMLREEEGVVEAYDESEAFSEVESKVEVSLTPICTICEEPLDGLEDTEFCTLQCEQLYDNG